jgi:HAD superfamily hydrolase (TIGR01509 family)
MSPESTSTPPVEAGTAWTEVAPGRDRLVIFDCDGVLVDSETISVAVLLEMIVAAGGRLSEADIYRRFLGRSMASVRQSLRSDFGVDPGPEAFARMGARLYERFRAELRPMPGMADVLARLSCARCVASSAEPERIRVALQATGLLELLEPHIYSATMVSRGKPAPDLFLYAAEQMGVAPADCVVIEDSPAGIEAARGAGMRVFAFTGGSHVPLAGGAAALATMRPDAIFDDMRRLPAMLAHANGRSVA